MGFNSGFKGLIWREGKKNFPENNSAKKGFSSAPRNKMTDMATVGIKE